MNCEQGRIIFGINTNSIDPDQLVRIYQSAYGKTYNKTCVTRKDSDQPVHPSGIARVLVYFSFNSLKAVEGTCDQRSLIRLRGCAG